MNQLQTTLECHLKTFLGYPCNTSYDYTDVLPYFKYNVNNVGCPFTDGTYKVNTKQVEREVLEFFADLWGINFTNTWGYITSAGTEGNLQGLYVGRECLGRNCVFYTSKESHYSLFKIARILCLDLCVINTTDNGEIDYEHFETKLLENINKPVLINVNLGTTMKGAIDNTSKIYNILSRHSKTDYYMHADGALMGFVIPFMKDSEDSEDSHDSQDNLFFKKYIHSISISGHKFLGIKFPCGIFLMEQRFLDKIKNDVEYIGTTDCTISGSRNGHTPLFFKHIIATKGIPGFRNDVQRCISLAHYVTFHITTAWMNKQSITVVFPRPSNALIDKWQLASQGNISHIVVMPHVTMEMLDNFIAEYKLDMKLT